MTTKLIDLRDEIKTAIEHAPDMGVLLTTKEYGIRFTPTMDMRVTVHPIRQECYVCVLSALALYRQELAGGSLPVSREALNEVCALKDTTSLSLLCYVLDINYLQAKAFIQAYDGGPIGSEMDDEAYRFGLEANGWAFPKG